MADIESFYSTGSGFKEQTGSADKDLFLVAIGIILARL